MVAPDDGIKSVYGAGRDRISLTGFEAYGHTPHNPAESVARALDGKLISGSEVVSRIVPNNFFECIDAVRASIIRIKPEIVVMMGEYGGRATITVERIAQNLNDSTRYGLADNKGCALQGQPTVPGGPVAYYSRLPVRAMVKAMREAGSEMSLADGDERNETIYEIVEPGGWSPQLVPIQKWPISPISALREKFNPRNINHMPAVEFFVRLDLDQICLFLDGH